MGQRLCGVGSTKRGKILEEWKCPGANWEFCIDCVKVNDNLHMQLCKKEAKLKEALKDQEKTQAKLNETEKKQRNTKPSRKIS